MIFSRLIPGLARVLEPVLRAFFSLFHDPRVVARILHFDVILRDFEKNSHKRTRRDVEPLVCRR